jgi:RNA polymerase sigma-70 factor (ECF subfamily)
MDVCGQPPEELLADALRGRREALGALLEVYRHYLYLQAQAQLDLHLRARANPSDLVQETFLQACRHFEQFRGQSPQELLGWLRRILAHSVARLSEKQLQARKRDARREISLEQLPPGNEGEPLRARLVSPGSSPSTQAQRREVSEQVAGQLALLPEAYRDVLVLRNLEGLAFDEVARRMGRSPGAVRVLWLRALEQLRQRQLGDDEP